MLLLSLQAALAGKQACTSLPKETHEPNHRLRCRWQLASLLCCCNALLLQLVQLLLYDEWAQLASDLFLPLLSHLAAR